MSDGATELMFMSVGVIASSEFEFCLLLSLRIADHDVIMASLICLSLEQKQSHRSCFNK